MNYPEGWGVLVSQIKDQELQDAISFGIRTLHRIHDLTLMES